MRKNLWSILFTLLFATMAVYFLVPSFKIYTMDPEQRQVEINSNPELRKKIVNMGLDIQGGMRLVLQVDTTNLKVKNDPMLLDRAYTIIENRINAIGLTEPTIQKIPQHNRLIIELPGLNDEKAAKEVLGKTAKLYFHTLRDAATAGKAANAVDMAIKGEVAKEPVQPAATDSAQTTTPAATDSSASDSTKDTAKTVVANTDSASKEQKIGEQLFTGSDAKKSDDLDELTGTTKTADSATVPAIATKLFSEYAFLQGNIFTVREADQKVVDNILNDEKVVAALKKAVPGSTFAWGAETVTAENGMKIKSLYIMKTTDEMTGENIIKANHSVAQGDLTSGGNVVHIDFDNKGAKDFARVTARNKGKQLAIVLDNTVYSAPNVNEKITMGSAQITGSFTRDEAKNLAVVLQAGALPAPVEIIEERTVGPSLGQEAVQSAGIAAAIAFGLIAIFMIIYYRLSGVLAIIALTLNIIFVLALMASFGATLTLPGIAGLILTMGTAIDSNVIIFERIREERRLGKGIITSIEAGYDRAFLTIMDSNITVFLTAIILFYVGSGPIKGFAVTMMLGILVSLFTALTFTKMIFHLVYGNEKAKTLSI